jgi:hypothetical protein
MQRRFGWYEWITVGLFALVAGAAIAQAISERSWEPMLTVAWLPAVLVASLSTRRTRGRCWPRAGRRLDP